MNGSDAQYIEKALQVYLSRTPPLPQKQRVNYLVDIPELSDMRSRASYYAILSLTFHWKK